MDNRQQTNNYADVLICFASDINTNEELAYLRPSVEEAFANQNFILDIYPYMYQLIADSYLCLTEVQRDLFIKSLEKNLNIGQVGQAINAFIKIIPYLDEKQLFSLTKALVSQTPVDPKLASEALIHFLEFNKEPAHFTFLLSLTNNTDPNKNSISQIAKEALVSWMLAKETETLANEKPWLGSMIEEYEIKAPNPDFMVVKAIATLCNLTNTSVLLTPEN